MSVPVRASQGSTNYPISLEPLSSLLICSEEIEILASFPEANSIFQSQSAGDLLREIEKPSASIKPVRTCPPLTSCTADNTANVGWQVTSAILIGASMVSGGLIKELRDMAIIKEEQKGFDLEERDAAILDLRNLAEGMGFSHPDPSAALALVDIATESKNVDEWLWLTRFSIDSKHSQSEAFQELRAKIESGFQAMLQAGFVPDYSEPKWQQVFQQLDTSVEDAYLRAQEHLTRLADDLSNLDAEIETLEAEQTEVKLCLLDMLEAKGIHFEMQQLEVARNFLSMFPKMKADKNRASEMENSPKWLQVGWEPLLEVRRSQAWSDWDRIRQQTREKESLKEALEGIKAQADAAFSKLGRDRAARTSRPASLGIQVTEMATLFPSAPDNSSNMEGLTPQEEREVTTRFHDEPSHIQAITGPIRSELSELDPNQAREGRDAEEINRFKRMGK